ncbi:hypothetical protein Tco_0714388 [Tanacetum coccineum]
MEGGWLYWDYIRSVGVRGTMDSVGWKLDDDRCFSFWQMGKGEKGCWVWVYGYRGGYLGRVGLSRIRVRGMHGGAYWIFGFGDEKEAGERFFGSAMLVFWYVDVERLDGDMVGGVYASLWGYGIEVKRLEGYSISVLRSYNRGGGDVMGVIGDFYVRRERREGRGRVNDIG